jgi:DNA-binding transcriptional ArsR family regulator
MTRPRSTTTTGRRGTKSRRLDDSTRLAKALSHPLRTSILIRLNEVVASPNELAQELGEPLGNVSYHVRALADLGCVELVSTAPRRGAVEHYYRAIERAVADDEAWASLPGTARRGFATEWFKATFEDVTQAIDAGRLEARPDIHLSFTTLSLDEEAWEELGELLKEVLDRAMELQAEAAGRRANGQADGEVFTRLAIAQYEGVAQPSRPKAKKKK